MANDPQPLGYITLYSAFEAYIAAWDGRDQDDLRHEILRAFAEADLTAIVKFPDRDGDFVVPQKLWSEEGFPDRVFLADDVVEYAQDGWAPYAARTPFVNETKFSAWLERNRP